LPREQAWRGSAGTIRIDPAPIRAAAAPSTSRNPSPAEHVMNDDDVHRIEEKAGRIRHLADSETVKLNVQGSEETIEGTEFQS
jgi:hypothetical protein